MKKAFYCCLGVAFGLSFGCGARVQCPDGTFDIGGTCVTECPLGQVDFQGSCVDECPLGTEEIVGVCLEECATNEIRVDGECTLDLREWTTPVRLVTVNSTNNDELSPSLSHDGLELVYVSDRITERWAVYVAMRASTGAAFGSGLVALEREGDALQEPELSPDGMELFGWRSLGILYRSTRTSRAGEWSPPVDVEGGSSVLSPSLSGDGLTLYFRAPSERTIYKMERTSVGAEFGPREIIDVPTLATLDVQDIDISSDELQLLISDFNTQTLLGEVYIARRESVTEQFGIPELIEPISNAGAWTGASFNADATEIYLNNAGEVGLDRDLYVSFLR